MHLDEIGSWSGNWAWGLVLILLTIYLHVWGDALIHVSGLRRAGESAERWASLPRFIAVLSVTILLVTTLHGVEAAIWGLAYLLLGALTDLRMAMLFSLNAVTTYGHDNIVLAPHWRLMGALEALNGALLFGLTTAFLYAIIQLVWPRGAPRRQRA